MITRIIKIFLLFVSLLAKVAEKEFVDGGDFFREEIQREFTRNSPGMS